MLPYRIRPEAEADLSEAYRWYERQREGLGADFFLCFEEALEKSRRNPDRSPSVYKTIRRARTNDSGRYAVISSRLGVLQARQKCDRVSLTFVRLRRIMKPPAA